MLRPTDPRPSAAVARVEVRPNRYDARRLHVIVLNWTKNPTVSLELGHHLETGDSYRLMSPRDIFGKPVVTGVYDGRSIAIQVPSEFGVYVLMTSA